MPPLAVPPPAKPHGFPPKLAIYSKNYTNTRYTETGRLALSVPSTTVLAHALVPPRQLPPQTRQNYAAAIVASVITSSQPMATVLNAIASRSSPCTIHELFDKCNQNSETRPAEWSKIAMRWSVRPMVPVHVLDPRQSELAAPWRSMLESLSPAEAEYVQGKNPRMVLMVGVEWVGYPEGMFADSPSPDGQSTRVGLVERYGLVVGDLGRLPAAAKPPPRTLPVLSFGPFPALPRLGSRPANPVGLPIPAAGSAANIASSSLSDSGGSDLDDNDEEGGWEVYVDGGYVRVDSASDDNIGGSGSDSESLTDIDVDLESTAMDGNPPSQHQQRQAHGLQPNEARTLVGTPSALLTFMSRRRRIGRYIHGQIRVHGRVTAIVNELVAPRAWTTEQLDIYLAAVIADAGNGLVARVLAFAFRRGPMRPFSLNDLVEGVPVQVQEGSTARKRLRIALSRCVVCPLHVVDRLPREGNGEVWDRLVSAVAASGGNEVPQSATLGVMAGVELVGFETPRPGDEIPPCHARRFVVRERYAILV
ncbi:hypothetical protein BCR44DRAFT_1432414 [Catenaria anguillulae PL171]|uniref:Uncharacterized protein n=1 Tax=Catenaria anguillulae PL171 TaxID=765915 RepID=A0A1Y2HNX2_9FUNG|nr:hypothetical protein BCR44DRAFT_1432414 [Catenaria anguillulae PL171]